MMEGYLKEQDILGGYPVKHPLGSVCEGSVTRVTEQGVLVKVHPQITILLV